MKRPASSSFLLVSRLLAGLFICSLLSSCDPTAVTETHEVFLKEKWDYSDAKTFTADIQDTVTHYNLYINIRHGFNFEWRNLWVKVETTFPDGKKFEKRVNLVLSEANGEWFGDCLGDNCDLKIPIQQNAYFPQLGKYTFRLTQDMRQNPLGYIKSVGMRVEKAKANK